MPRQQAPFPQCYQHSSSRPTAPVIVFPLGSPMCSPGQWLWELNTSCSLSHATAARASHRVQIPERCAQRNQQDSVLFGTRRMSQHWLIDINALKSLWKVKTNDATCSAREKVSALCKTCGYTEGFLLQKRGTRHGSSSL